MDDPATEGQRELADQRGGGLDLARTCTLAGQVEVFGQVANLLSVEVGLLFSGTTSACSEAEGEDEPVVRDKHSRPVPGSRDGDGQNDAGGQEKEKDGGKLAALRASGKSRDHRDDLPQIVTGMAVTRDGIPVTAWCWPGDTGGSKLIRQAKDEMRDRALARIVRAAAGAPRRRATAATCGPAITTASSGRSCPPGPAEAKAALSRQGRYQEVAADLRVREVRISEHERFVTCRNPEGAGRDAAVRTRMLAPLEQVITGTGNLTATKRAGLRAVISARRGLNRYLTVTPGGLPRADAAAIKAGENLDGKDLLRTSGPRLSAGDIALGCKQLPEAGRGWRDMKQVIGLRPACHPKEQPIRAHVMLCWLALLLIPITESTTESTWPAPRRELQRIALGTLTGPAGTFRQRTEITQAQRDIFAQPSIEPPPRIFQLTAGTP